MATKIKNQADWASALLGALGDPNSKTNVANITAWEGLEGGNWNNTAHFNPLNTSEQEKGSVNYNTGQPGGGVQSYKSWKQGLDATVATLKDGQISYGYAPILADLNTSQNWDKLLGDLKTSSWDGGHYAGVKGGATAPTSGSPSGTAYGVGTSATTQDGSAANSPSTSTSPTGLTGMAGILQALDGLYNPNVDKKILGFIPNVPADLAGTLSLIFVRGTSALLSVGLIAIGITTMLRGSTSGGGTGASSSGNVLEFVNNAKISNTHTEQSERRLKVAEAEAQRKASEFTFKSGPVKEQAKAYTTHRAKSNARNKKYRENKSTKGV
jgi:hypothetical protein